MNYRPKVVRCRLKTGGKSIPQIREECRGQGLTYRDFENIQRSNEEFDGLVVLLSLWAYDNHASYHLHNWDPADDERMMMAIYYAEQVHPFPRYKNDLVKFKADWAAQAYDPGVPDVRPGGRGGTGSSLRGSDGAGTARPSRSKAEKA